MKCALVIDDQPAVRRLMSEILRQIDFQVITAQGGEEAFCKLAEWDVDLIILDMKMPNMSGVEFLRQPRFKSYIPKVIVVTAYSESEVLNQAQALGVRYFLHKPFDVDLLRRLAKNIIGCNYCLAEVAQA